MLIKNMRLTLHYWLKRTTGWWGGLIGWLLVLNLNAQAQTKAMTFQSSEKRIALVELYTSEGCSSCPPAEDWLSQLKNDPGLWKDFVPVAFHVDYWDDLGWKDPWASREYTDRQKGYALSWKSSNIYTPELVLSGREWRNWADRKSGPTLTTKVGMLKATSTDGSHWQVQFVATAPRAGYEIHAALLSSALTSEVKAGENAGRKLGHDFVVTSLNNAIMTKTGEGFRGDVLVAPNPKMPAGRLALAVWVTGVGELEPLQAAGGWIDAK